MKEKYRRKDVKKLIKAKNDDIDKGVGVTNKKEKHLDLTDEIKIFLREDITLDSIKKILLRLHGPVSVYQMSKSKLTVISLKRFLSDSYIFHDYIFHLNCANRTYNFFLGAFVFVTLDHFFAEKIDRSQLKQNLAHALKNWCYQNPDKIRIIE